jgi:hypothetical protein
MNFSIKDLDSKSKPQVDENYWTNQVDKEQENQSVASDKGLGYKKFLVFMLLCPKASLLMAPVAFKKMAAIFGIEQTLPGLAGFAAQMGVTLYLVKTLQAWAKMRFEENN